MEILELIKELESDFEAVVGGMAEVDEEGLESYLSEIDIDIGGIKPDEMGIVLLSAMGMGPYKVARVSECSRSRVRRILEDEENAVIFAAARRYFSMKMFQWVASLVPLSVKALRDVLGGKNETQKLQAARMVFGLMADGRSSSEREAPGLPLVPPPATPGTWELLTKAGGGEALGAGAARGAKRAEARGAGEDEEREREEE